VDAYQRFGAAAESVNYPYWSPYCTMLSSRLQFSCEVQCDSLRLDSWGIPVLSKAPTLALSWGRAHCPLASLPPCPFATQPCASGTYSFEAGSSSGRPGQRFVPTCRRCPPGGDCSVGMGKVLPIPVGDAASSPPFPPPPSPSPPPPPLLDSASDAVGLGGRPDCRGFVTPPRSPDAVMAVAGLLGRADHPQQQHCCDIRAVCTGLLLQWSDGPVRQRHCMLVRPLARRSMPVGIAGGEGGGDDWCGPPPPLLTGTHPRPVLACAGLGMPLPSTPAGLPFCSCFPPGPASAGASPSGSEQASPCSPCTFCRLVFMCRNDAWPTSPPPLEQLGASCLSLARHKHRIDTHIDTLH
jgi:hypothetical protein